jgi:hypothetical protein
LQNPVVWDNQGLLKTEKAYHPHPGPLPSREREADEGALKRKRTIHPHPDPLPSREREIKEVGHS